LSTATAIRGSFKWRQVRQMRDCTAGSPFVMSMNEPPGPNSSLSTNDSPVQLGIMRATAHTQGCALSVLHVGDMVTGLADPSRNRHANLWEVPGLDAILQAVRRVDAFLPEGVENWQNTNQHGHTDRVGPHPLLADGIWSDGDDHGVDRAHGAVSGNAFVEVLLGVKDYVNLQAAQALAFDALDPATGTVTHYELGAGQSARLAGRGAHDGRLSHSGHVQVSVSNWHKATELHRLMRERELICPSCTAANRPGVTQIHLARDGRAFCDCCSQEFDVPVKET
jgi:hypothetical protein